MVPVSSSQVIVGCVIGIGLYKGARNINFRLLGEIAIGWISTPVISGLLAFFSLFFMKNLFGIDIGHKISDSYLSDTLSVQSGAGISQIFRYLLFGLIAIGIIATFLYFLFEWRKEREFRLSEKRFWKSMK
jgi:phosphate/sulfate permease